MIKLIITPSRLHDLAAKVLLLCAGLWPAANGLMAAGSDLYHVDPAKVQGTENCAECHAPMVEVLKLTHHYTTFLTTHQGDAARQIMAKLDIRRMKAESLCLKCHYTSQGSGDAIKVISGISCESCHAAAADWNKAHSNKDDPERLAKAEKLGLLRPNNYYFVAANCFSCHTVPEEKLVNVGGHTAGSAFELVAWSQGEVRHNLQQSAGKLNAEAPLPVKRMLYIVGQALDLEYGLRGMAKATQPGTYAESMAKRVEAARSKVKEIQDALKTGEIQQMLDAAASVELKINNSESLTQAAEKIAAVTRQFSSGNDGAKFAAIDPLLPRADQFKGKVYTP